MLKQNNYYNALPLLLLLFWNSMHLQAKDIDATVWLTQSEQNLAPALETNNLTQALTFYTSNQIDSAVWHLEQVLQQLENSKYQTEQVALRRLLGQIYVRHLQNYEKSKGHLEPALRQLSSEAEPFAYLSTLDWLTASYYWLFEAEQALKYGLEGLELAEAEEDTFYEAIFTQWLGKVFVLQQQWDNALMYYERMVDLTMKMDDPTFKFGAHLNLACTHFKSGDPEAALPYLADCEQYLQACPKDVRREATLLIWKGVIFGANERYEESETILKEVMGIYDSLAIPNRQMHVRLELGKLYMKQEKYRDCVQLVEATLKLLPDKITRFEKKFAYSLLYKSYKKLGNYKKAMESFEYLDDVETELSTINNDKTIQELEKKYQTAEQQQIIERQITQRRWLGTALLLATLLLVSTVVIISNLRRSKRKLAQQHQIIQQQAQELQTLDELKSNFFINVAHELRTPLTLLLGPISSTLKSGTLSNRNFTLLQKAQQSGQELKKMITSILNLSKMEAQKMEIEWQATLLYAFVRRLAAAFESQADIRQIQYTFIYEAEANLTVEIDQEKLTVLINNLLSNALKFTSSPGEVRFTVKDKGHQLEFEVMDTGRGIHPKDLPHIFNRYYQSKQQHNRVEGGTGIGLALSQEYAKLMGGEIQVKSELNKGSTFIATIARREILGIAIANELKAEEQQLEMVTTASSDNRNDPPSAAPSSESRILVVEDNHSLRDYLKTILEPHYHVQLADNGKRALQWLEQQAPAEYPHFILSDIMMPEMDGYELLETLKGQDQFRGIPIVMLTARANLQDKLKALRIGVDDYLIKPFDEEELLTRIQNLLHNYHNRLATAKETPGEAAEADRPIISEEDRVWLEELEQILQTQLANSGYTISQLANDMALSERQTRRRIRELVGLTPKQYFVSIRLQQARQLLEQKRYKTIAQTASAVGFKNSSAFSRSFVKQYGKSPSAYL